MRPFFAQVATGLCLSGFFRVKLMQRQVDAFDGVEVGYGKRAVLHLQSSSRTFLA
jgi:hypothetical protein